MKREAQSPKHNWKAKMVYVDPESWKRWMDFNAKMYSQSTSARLRSIIDADLNQEPGMQEKYDFELAYSQLSKFGEEIKRLQRILDVNIKGQMERLSDSLCLKHDLSNLKDIIPQLLSYKPQEYDSFDQNDLVIWVQMLTVIKKRKELLARVFQENAKTQKPTETPEKPKIEEPKTEKETQPTNEENN